MKNTKKLDPSATEKKLDKKTEAEFQAACKKARELLVEAERDDVQARYKIGVIVNDVKEEAKYGESGVERLEKEIGVEKKSLYKYGKVAEAWAEPDFARLVKKVNSKELPLTWSHYELIAKVKDGSVRGNFIAQAQEECLSVRDLRAIMRSVNKKGDKGGSSASAAIRQLARALNALEQQARTWEQALPSLIASREKIGSKDIAKLGEALARVKGAKVTLGRLSDGIEKVLAPPQERAPTRLLAAGAVTQMAAGA